MNSTTVKNLAIALEALTRVPNTDSLRNRIEDLIADQLKEAETSIEPSNPDDEIPF